MAPGLGDNSTRRRRIGACCKFIVGCGAGTYQFRISRPGYRTETATVVVPGPDGCPTNRPKETTVELTRQP